MCLQGLPAGGLGGAVSAAAAAGQGLTEEQLLGAPRPLL